ncbi:YqjK-like family protein [Haliea sp. E1-2-M8]|uniref:YqjK-like family protein n=1 Tax=Haliea sp. E1-2-M8 TaxID=3064706 RepID=UPI0027260391|nr:YqjK-like family protein [Haliea sp. E1-2-M8]MDO8862106.1 YqjK-like family protein [Haliea sp. E1-2-M8]
MSAKRESIAARRRMLIGEIARQRQSLGQEVASWAAPLAVVDQGLNVLRYVKRHPIMATVAVSLLLKLRRGGRTTTWLSRGLIAWRLIDRFNGLGRGDGGRAAHRRGDEAKEPGLLRQQPVA